MLHRPARSRSITGSAARAAPTSQALQRARTSTATCRGITRLCEGLHTAIREALSLDNMRVIPVSDSIATEAGLLGSSFHGDPADRIIVATALELRGTLVTKDERIRESKRVSTLW
ncbi:MAG TPA: PIN domain-containing protein [Polyangiales bacterium]